jgi:hypothetical protein
MTNDTRSKKETVSQDYTVPKSQLEKLWARRR